METTMMVDLSIFPLCSVSFFFMYFEAMLLGTYTFKMVISFFYFHIFIGV